jgi:hypothetical protein
MRPDARDAARFASQVAADPAAAVGRWRATTGGKAVGCLPPAPVPEILHAGGLLPVQLDGPDIPDRLPPRIDAWVVGPEHSPLPESESGKPRFAFPATPLPDVPSALDLLESLSVWVAGISGRPVTEGALWKSIDAYRERAGFLRLLSIRDPHGRRFPSGTQAGDLARAGDFLPPEAHSVLLARSLARRWPAGTGCAAGERGDPLVFLSRRLAPGSGRKRQAYFP